MGELPVLLVTVCRRYHELERNLVATLSRCEEELGGRPDVVLVWARPEPGRSHLMDRLRAAGALTHLLGRPPLPDEGDDLPTTHPESRNIRMGLEFVRRTYGPGRWVLFQTADVSPRAGTVGLVRDRMEGGARAVVFHWANGCVPRGIWHTNFFGVALGDERYWPPVSPPGHPDVLERQWGASLEGLDGVWGTHNHDGRRFAHAHESEGLPPYPLVPVPAGAGVPTWVRGRFTLAGWAAGVLTGLTRGFPWLRWWSSSTR